MSGIVIGILTNYLITYVFPLPFWYGLILCIILLSLSFYGFLLYSPQIIYGQAIETIPKTLHEFLHRNFGKLLLYIKLDLEGYAFHKNAVSYDGFMAITLEYPFFRYFKCRITLRIFVTSLRTKLRKVIIDIELNRLARLHPKSDQILHTIGKRLFLAIQNPQIVNPNISDEEFKKILKELRPYMLED
jgi:hypothetical protein